MPRFEDVAAFLVDHRIGQAEFRDLRAHHAAGLRVGIEHHAGVAERRQIACDRQRGRAAADQRDALAVAARRRLRQAGADVVLVIGGDALEPADRHRFVLHPNAPARRLAWAVAGAPENPGKHVGLPIDHVGVAVAAFGDQPDIFGNWGVCRTSPLAIDHFVEIVRLLDVGKFHSLLVHAPLAVDSPGKDQRAASTSFHPLGSAYRAESRRDVSGPPRRMPLTQAHST